MRPVLVVRIPEKVVVWICRRLGWCNSPPFDEIFPFFLFRRNRDPQKPVCLQVFLMKKEKRKKGRFFNRSVLNFAIPDLLKTAPFFLFSFFAVSPESGEI